MKNLVSIVLISSLIWWLVRGKKETTETPNDKYVSTGLFSRVYSSTSSVSPSQSVATTPTVSTSSPVSSTTSSSGITTTSDSASTSSPVDSGGSINPGSRHIADDSSSFTFKKSKSAFV